MYPGFADMNHITTDDWLSFRRDFPDAVSAMEKTALQNERRVLEQLEKDECLSPEDEERLNYMRKSGSGEPDPDTKFVLLEGIERGNRFFTTYTPGNDPTRGHNGELWYRIIGYAKTVEEAQIKLYGVSYK